MAFCQFEYRELILLELALIELKEDELSDPAKELRPKVLAYVQKKIERSLEE